MSPLLSSFLGQYLHCSGTIWGERRPLGRFAREERRLGPRKSIYLFIYVPRGGLRLTRGCDEARLIVSACIEPGIPWEYPVWDKGTTAKVTGNDARILDSVGLSEHSHSRYTQCLLIRTFNMYIESYISRQ